MISTRSARPIAAVRSLSDLPIVAQMTTEEDGNTLDGTPPEKVRARARRPRGHDRRAELQRGPAPMLETIDRIEQSVHVPLSAQPNAGRPRDIEGRTIYLSSPEYMASYARRFVAQGVRLVGGCCGTTPEHIRQIKRAVQAVAHAPASTERPSGTATVTVEPPAAPPVPRAEKSRMAHALARGTSSSRRNCRRRSATTLRPPSPARSG